jgi:hypothetical protein
MRWRVLRNAGKSGVDNFVDKVSSQIYKFQQRGVAQPGRALGSGPRGRRFESSSPGAIVWRRDASCRLRQRLRGAAAPHADFVEDCIAQARAKQSFPRIASLERARSSLSQTLYGAGARHAGFVKDCMERPRPIKTSFFNDEKCANPKILLACNLLYPR